MPKVQPTTTLNVDGAVFHVDKMNDQIKQLISFMDDWRQREADVASELTMIRGALRDVQNTIYVAINKEKQEAMAKAQAMGLVPEAPPVEANDDAEFAEVESDKPAGE